MNIMKSKTFLMGLLVLAGVQFSDCKSKKTETNTTTTSTDSSGSTSATQPEPAPVEISADETLQSGLTDATKDFPDVKSTVNNGEVTLTGNITRDKLPKLMQSVQSLHPKKVNNNLTIK